MASYRLAKRLLGRHVWVAGYNGAGAATEEDIWDYSAAWTPIAAAGVLLEVGSSDITDDVGNTGALSVRVYGLDIYKMPIWEDFAMDGQTPVSGVKTFYRVLGAEVLTAGTNGANAGVIYIADAATAWVAGVPSTTTAIQATIAIGYNVSRLGWYTAQQRAFWVKDLYLSNTTAAAEVRLKVREYGDLWKTEAIWQLPATGPVLAMERLKEFVEVPPGADVKLTVVGNTAITSVLMHLEMV